MARVSSLLILSMFLIGAGLSGCSSPGSNDGELRDPNLALAADSPGLHRPPKPLVPRGILLYTGKNAPIVKYVAPGKAAARAGILPNDQFLRLNGIPIMTASEFEEKLHLAPRHSSITLRRRGQIRQVNVILADEKPRLGAFFEPMGIPLSNTTSPYIAYMHLKDMTVFAETSFNPRKKEIHLNLIMQSMKPVPFARMNYFVSEKGKTRPLARGFENIDALSSDSRIFTRVIPDSGKLNGPLQVSVNIDRNHFHFEFQ